MTQKDYIKFAKLIKSEKEVAYKYAKAGVIIDIDACISYLNTFQSSVANLFANDNPRFNRNKFNKACELTKEVG